MLADGGRQLEDGGGLKLEEDTNLGLGHSGKTLSPLTLPMNAFHSASLVSPPASPCL